MHHRGDLSSCSSRRGDIILKHKKRLAACLLTAALTVSTLCTGAFAWNTPIKVAHRFEDVGSSDWFCGAVQTAFDKGYMSGTSNTTFVPRGATTRAAFVQTLYAKAGSPSVNSSNPFHDVKSGDWYYSAVLWASQNGITNGTSATTFSPNANVTREQLAVFCMQTQANRTPPAVFRILQTAAA